MIGYPNKFNCTVQVIRILGIRWPYNNQYVSPAIICVLIFKIAKTPDTHHLHQTQCIGVLECQ